MKRLALYYQLTKPGIIRGNAVHTLAGALFASTITIDWQSLIGVLIGTSLVIASACVSNNYLDREIDRKMDRTKGRPSATGAIPLHSAMVFAALLLIVGFGVLYFLTNWYVILIGLVAYVFYVAIYGWAKRKTVYSTLIGAIPGALPAMAGYVAIDGVVSLNACLVFLLIFIWQMPHFYAISLFRRKEYRKAGLPVLGAVKSFEAVKNHILLYIVLYTCVITAMITTETVHPVAGLLLLAGAAYWLYVCMTSERDDVNKWARSVFGASLVLTLLLPIVGALDMIMSF